MSLGDVVRQMFAGMTPSGGHGQETPDQIIARGVREAGGSPQLARMLGVTERAVQRWRAGTRHPNKISLGKLRSTLQSNRILTSDSLVIKGSQPNGAGRKARPRTVNLGQHLESGTMQRAADAYQRGASSADIHLIVWSGITDKEYRRLFAPPGWAGKSESERVRASERVNRLVAGGDTPGGGFGAPGASGGGGEGDGDEEEEDSDYYEDYDADDVAWDPGGDTGYEIAATSATA